MNNLISNKAAELQREIQALRTGQHATRKLEWSEVVSKVMPEILQAANLQENVRAVDNKKRRKCPLARAAVMKLASAYMSYITPMGEKWFGYKPWNLHQYESEQVQEDLIDALNRASDDVFEECEKSNLYNELFPCFYDLTCTGTMLISCSFDKDKNELVFKHHPVGTFDLGPEGSEKVAIDFKLSAEQIAKEFPDVDLPGSVKTALMDNSTTEFTITQYVKPRKGGDESYDAVDASTFPYANYYILKDANVILKEDGYPEFPFAVVRFTRTGNQVYGTSPLLGIEEYIDDLITMDSVTVEAAKRRAIPPVLIPPDMRGQVSLGAGQQTVVPRHYINSQVPREWALASDTRELLDQIAQKGRYLNDAMFITFLEVISGVPDSHQMTATEVQAREAEKVMAYAQPFTQFVSDWKPMQKRIFAECARNGILDLDDLPEEVLVNTGEERYLSMPRIAYLGRMAQALQRAQLTNTDVSVTRLVELAKMLQDPELLMFIDWGKLSKGQAIANGMPARYMHSRAKVEEMKEQLLTRRQQQITAEQSLMEAEAAEHSANAAATIREMNQ